MAKHNLTYNLPGGGFAARMKLGAPPPDPRLGFVPNPAGVPPDPHLTLPYTFTSPSPFKRVWKRSANGGSGGKVPRGVWGKAPTGVWGWSPQLHSCGEAARGSEGGAPSNRNLSCFGIGGQYKLTASARRLIRSERWSGF